MKNNLRYIICILLFVMLVSLCACSIVSPIPKGSLDKDTSEAQPETAAEEPVITEAPEILPEVIISEIMASNKAAYADENGEFPDWLELYNYGSDVAVLDDCVLKCGSGSYTLSSMSLMPGEYAVLFCGNVSGADFSISSAGETVSLFSSRGTFIDEFTVGVSDSDESFCKDIDGSITATYLYTPGFENSAEGYAAFQSSLENTSPLLITEVMVYNQWIRKGSECYDMVELKNVSSEAVKLSDYYLSDSGSNRALYQLPDEELESGKTYLIYCTDGKEEKTFDGAAPFALSADYDRLYLSRSDGTLMDYVSLRDVPYGGTKGRMDSENGFFLFKSPAFGKAKQGGMRSVAPMPVSAEPDGVFSDVSSVSVTLSGTGKVYYTTDGSIPTASSTLYTQPIEITKTGVIRAVNVVDGCLDSDVLSLSYIINEGHELPVVSLVCAPDLFTKVYKSPTKDYEERCNVTLYDGDDGFTIDCGFKLHGATSKVAQSKKSLKLTFRSRYSGELNYDLFNNGILNFSSVLLRAAQEDTYSTQMRDNLMHQLAIQGCDSLSTQDYKYVVLYVNGQYWGLYNFREAHSAEHYANHFGYDADTVTQYKEAWPSYSDFSTAFNLSKDSDMRLAENYSAVAAVFDIDSIIQWSFVEAYSDNIDCNSPNMRFYLTGENNMMHFALVDLDLGMFSKSKCFDVPFHSGYAYNKLAYNLLDNSDYRQRLIETASELLSGPFSDENALNTLNSLADQIVSEIPRDRDRWGGSLGNWQRMYEYLQEFLDGRAKKMAQSLKECANMTSEEYNKYFGFLE